MSEVRDAIHNHHTAITQRLATYSAALDASEGADPAGLVEFLKEDLLPHAAGEERSLYPAVEPLIREHGSPTATMIVDHEFIAGYVARLDEAASAYASAPDQARPDLRKKMARLALQLQAVLEAHLEKEERIYLPLFERYVPAKAQHAILDGMHEAPEVHDTKGV